MSGRTIEPASVRAIAGTDVRAAGSAPFRWTGAFAFLVTALAAVAVVYAGGATTPELVVVVGEVARLVVPVVALGLGCTAIADDREGGRVGVTLSLSHSRADLLVGKLLGRAGILAASLLVGFAAAGVVVAVVLPSFSPVGYAAFLGLTILYGAAYVAIAVAISALAPSRRVAVGAAAAVLLAFYVGWNAIQSLLWVATDRGYVDGVTIQGGVERVPDWALFVEGLEPGTAYRNALSVVGTGEGSVGSGLRSVYFPDGIPFFVQEWFSVVVLLAWIAVPVALALAGFRRADL